MSLSKSEQEQFTLLTSEKKYKSLHRPALIGDGILSFTPDEQKDYIKIFEEASCSLTVFIPASGAASRMFKHLHNLPSTEDLLTQEFLKNLRSFAFFRMLDGKFKESMGTSLNAPLSDSELIKLKEILFSDNGFNFRNLPKGLVPFHMYSNESRTAFEEQLNEASYYGFKNNSLDVHFTIPLGYTEIVDDLIKEFLKSKKWSSVNVGYSHQMAETNTICLNSVNAVYALENGLPLKRPGGHGSLIHNLDTIESELIFIKNIDNISTSNNHKKTSLWKKVLGGVCIEHQKIIHDYIIALQRGKEKINEIISYLNATFGYDCEGLGREGLIELLRRPLRVAGMVLNLGDPGGGPFFIEHKGEISLQIVESAEIDLTNPLQHEIFKSSTHFNPVDLVCAVRDESGAKYDLLKFVDKSAYFTSKKDYGGDEIKILEWPGLWNGAMAKWHSIFVEVPDYTFSPVKTVNDLIKKPHQS